jgi:YVTN family beta-propeller protein
MAKVRVGPHIWGIAFDEKLSTLYLAHTGTADVTALNETTHHLTRISVGAIPCAVAVNPLTQRLYAVNYGDQTLSVIDARTSKVLATLPVGKHPQAVAFDAVHNRVFVANVHGNSITAIDGAKNIVIGTYNAGNNPYALAIDPENSRVYAANYGDTPVTVLHVSR